MQTKVWRNRCRRKRRQGLYHRNSGCIGEKIWHQSTFKQPEKRGKLSFIYSSLEELDRLLEQLGYENKLMISQIMTIQLWNGENTNQIKRKRRLSALEAAVLGNILYIVIVLIFKNVFDLIRTSDFNYLFNGIQLLTVGAFWITLFAICFKNISGNEKPKAFRYVLYSLVPIIVLTATLTVVSIMFQVRIPTASGINLLLLPHPPFSGIYPMD